MKGVDRVGIKEKVGRISPGNYVYRIIANGKAYSQKIVISN